MATFIFGASTYGNEAYKILSKSHEITAFIDNDEKKHNKIFNDKKIVSLDAIKQTNSMHIIICSQFYLEIARQLINNNIKKFSIFQFITSNIADNLSDYIVQDYDFTERDLNKKTDEIVLYSSNPSGSNTLCLYNEARIKKIKGHERLKLINIEKTSSKFLEEMLFSKNIVTTHDTFTSKDSNYIQLWHGFPLKGLNYMSRYQPEKSQHKNHQYWQNYSLICSYSNTYSSLMGACYGVPIDKFSITGVPRNDLLINSRLQLKKIESAAKNCSLLFYLPTFRSTRFGQKNGDAQTSLFNMPVDNISKFDTFLENNKIKIVIKLHPYQDNKTKIAEVAKQTKNIIFLTEKDLTDEGVDLYNILSAFDALITDYSSVYFDYLLCDKPIIFTPTDYDKYNNDRGFLLEPYDFWSPGPKCFDQKTFEFSILEALNEPMKYSTARSTIKSIVHHFDDSSSTERVLNNIIQVIDKKS